MPRILSYRKPVSISALFIIFTIALANAAGVETTSGGRYEDLVKLFDAWREFQKPRLVDGIPDYSAPAMAAQHRELADYQRRLAAIDTSGWPVAQRIDYHLVNAEMNGLDFDHRVRRPWERDPALYAMIFPEPTDVPAREGPVIHGAIELWMYSLPLSLQNTAELAARISTIPKLLEQAKANLTGNARDLWISGIRRMKQQSADLSDFANKIAASQKSLAAAVRAAQESTDAFCAWLEQQSPAKTGSSGVGVENYNWYLQNVQLVPFTWQEQVTMMRRELARAQAALKLEEQRNRHLPALEPIATAEEYDRRLNDAVSEYMSFLRDHEIVSIRDDMDPALRARIGSFSLPKAGRREFFSEINYRDPLVMRTHGYHWFDLARMANAPHASPIRRVPLLYNIFAGRAEGMATGMEEMMMHAGLFDARPRARELIWILLAQRAARALGDLYMHSNAWTMAQAMQFASAQTPRGWLAVDGETVWFEQHLYLQQPSYGTTYLIGKIEIEQLLAERARQLADRFTLKGFMDEFNAAGMIPVSLIRWELTGEAGMIKQEVTIR